MDAQSLSEELIPTILLVDDVPTNLKILSKILVRHRYRILTANDGPSALASVQETLPDLVLLDVSMPGMDGYEVCEILKAQSSTSEIPVIFISALGETDNKVKGFTVGGCDYITKPFQVEEVLERVKHQITLRELQQQLKFQNQRLQKEIQIRQRVETEVRQLNSELTERVHQRTAALSELNEQLLLEVEKYEKAQKYLRILAFHDLLTRLPNRAAFLQHLKTTLTKVKRQSHAHFAVLFLDCDRFKVINDSLGHSVGDQLLKTIGQRLRKVLKDQDIVARLGGDEFTVLLIDIHSLQEAIETAQLLLEQFRLPFQLDDYEIFTNASIGIVLGSAAYDRAEDILRDADTAMYRAKALGKGRYQVFDAEMHTQSSILLWMETDLRRAVTHHEFVTYYQPIVCLKSGKIAGFEALVRWEHPHRGQILPTQFIPIAEETGSIIPMGRWILNDACCQLREWQLQGLISPYVTMSVNLSARQFWQPNLVEDMKNILAECNLQGCNLKMEITESALIDNKEFVSGLLEEMRAHQIRLCIDDFGTGFSSLSYLHQYPVNTVKIDRSFVVSHCHESKHRGIVEAIIFMAHHLGMDLVAEGVETQEQMCSLHNLNCEYGQGYYFSRPLTSAAMAELLAQDPCWLPS